MATSTYLPIITLNVNALYAPIKRQGDGMDRKARPIYRLPIRDSFQVQRHMWIDSEGMKNHLSCKVLVMKRKPGQ